jgi:hypothetical protein
MVYLSEAVERIMSTRSAVRARAALFLSLSLAITTSCSLYRGIASPEAERDISGRITASSEWTEIAPDKPLKSEREINAVMFNFETPLNEKDVITGNDVKRWGIRFPNGKVILPEVELIDQNGKTYPLSVSFFGTKAIGFGMRDPQTHLETLPRDKTYRAVRIRSDERVIFSRVYWYSYNLSDRK